MPSEAAEVFNRVVRQREVPADLQTVAMPEGVIKDGVLRVDKLLAQIGLAPSVSEAVRQDQGQRGRDQRGEGEGTGARRIRPRSW